MSTVWSAQWLIDSYSVSIKSEMRCFHHSICSFKIIRQLSQWCNCHIFNSLVSSPTHIRSNTIPFTQCSQYFSSSVSFLYRCRIVYPVNHSCLCRWMPAVIALVIKNVIVSAEYKSVWTVERHLGERTAPR